MVLASQPEGTHCRATLQASPCPLLMLQGIITLLDTGVVKHCWTRRWSNTAGHRGGQTLLDTGTVKHCWTWRQSNTARHRDSQTLLATATVKHCWTLGWSNTAGHGDGQTLLDMGMVTFTSLPHILLTYVARWSCPGVASASSDSCTYWG